MTEMGGDIWFSLSTKGFHLTLLPLYLGFRKELSSFGEMIFFRIWPRVIKMIKGLEHFSYKERLES